MERLDWTKKGFDSNTTNSTVLYVRLVEPCLFNILLLCRSLLASSSVFSQKSIFDYGNLDQTIAHNNLIVLITLYPYKKRQKTYIQPPPLTHVLTRKREFKGPFFLYLSMPYAQTSMQLSIQLQLLRWHNKIFTKSNKEERQL